MKLKSFFKYTFITLFSFGISLSSAHALNGIVAFGDSLTDNGNTSRRIGEYILPQFIWTIPNATRYHEGRFTNGLVWVEHVANNLNLPLEDEAQGSANAYDDAVRIPLLYPTGVVLSLVHQVEDYIYDFYGMLDSKKLYILWVGGNDYILSHEQEPKKVVDATLNALNQLYVSGARNFLVMNLPDLTLAPLVQEGGTDWDMNDLKNVLAQHNTKLAKQIQNFKDSANSAHIELYDMKHVLNQIMTHPSEYGFKNITERCYEGGYIFKWGDPVRPGPAESSLLEIFEKAFMYTPKIKYRDSVCKNPDTYLFWDTMHPTAQTHKVFASMITDFIRKTY